MSEGWGDGTGGAVKASCFKNSNCLQDGWILNGMAELDTLPWGCGISPRASYQGAAFIAGGVG